MNKWVYVAVGLRCQVVPLLFMGQRPTVIGQFWTDPPSRRQRAKPTVKHVIRLFV